MGTKTKILVCYHDVAPIIASDVLCPILLNAANAKPSVKAALKSAAKAQNAVLLRDDMGDLGAGNDGGKERDGGGHSNLDSRLDSHEDSMWDSPDSAGANPKHCDGDSLGDSPDSPAKNPANPSKSAALNPAAPAKSPAAQNAANLANPANLAAANPTAKNPSAKSPTSPAESAHFTPDSPHISQLNPYFCELTALYFAWKNPALLENPDYIGLFHYRRVLDFTRDSLFARLKRALTPQSRALQKYSLHKIPAFLAAHAPDIITPTPLNLAPHLDFYETYRQDHVIADFDLALDYIRAHYPEMQPSLEATIFGKGAAVFYCNVMIMRREIFEEYCAWLFDVLFAILPRIDCRNRDKYQARAFGFLAERLSNVFVHHKIRTAGAKTMSRWMPMLYVPNKKMFGWVDSREHRRFYCFFIRILKVKK